MAKLKRKDFFKGIALSTLSLPFLMRSCINENIAQSSAPNIITQRKYQWKMVTTWPPNFPVLGEGCNLFAEWVKAMSGGRMEIKVYGGGELVPALQAFDAVRTGAAEVGSGSAYYWAGKLPAAQFFATVPFGMNAQQMNAWVMHGGGIELWRKLYADFNLVPMLGGNTGVQMGGWFNREINSIVDLKGLKMRMPGLGGKVLERAGGAPVLLAGGEIYTGLERGVIDATEWIGPYHDYKMGFYQIAKYYYYPGWHEPGTVLEFFFNKEKLEALPTDLQQILQAAADRLNTWMLLAFESQNGIYLDKLKREENVDVRPFPTAVLEQLRQFNTEILNDLTSNDPVVAKVYSSYQSFRKRAEDWSRLSEKVYYDRLQLG